MHFINQSSLNCYSPASSAVVVTINICVNPCTPSATNPDTDGDGIADVCDWDDDNDGILDKDECNIGFIANNINGPWKGRTASNITIVATPNTTQKNVLLVNKDPQVNFHINRDGADPRFGNSATATCFVLTFSTPVPANEIGVMIDDVNVSSNRSPNAAFKIEVDFGSGFTDPQGTFIKTMAGRNEGVGYNAISGVPSFQDLPNPNDMSGEDIYLRGFGNTLIKAVRITGTNLGGTADSMAYSFFALSPCDTDGDGIPNDLDLDSDGDGCYDAIEGGENVVQAHLNNLGSIRTNVAGIANANNIVSIDTNGVPLLVNSGGTADTSTATAGSLGQPIGSSLDASIAPCCTNSPNLNPSTDFTQTGISTLQGFANGWPNNVPNGFIAIESKNKGFVITRVNHVGGTNGTPNLVTDSVKQPIEGMLVYDIQDSCVKLFNGKHWRCLAKDCGVPTN